jgi:hypothetical protein
VTTWSLWNEGNFPAWLYPQWRRVGRSALPVSPRLYRHLADAGWRGLDSSGHAGDTVLIGETAPYGPRDPKHPKLTGLMSPLVFIRELYCVNPAFRAYQGVQARRRGCPTTAASRGRFVHDHPGLFEPTGWAHHAYSLKRPPPFPGRRKEVVPLGAIGHLTSTLDRARFRWGADDEWPVWLTEYGYETRPPDPFRGLPFTRQAAWLSWAEYLSFRNPRIGSFAQFLLVDDAPRRKFRQRDPRRWITWQSGLMTGRGQAKPSYEEFKHPIFVTPTRVRRGQSVQVFGSDRVADNGAVLRAEVEFSTGGSWQTLRTLDVTNDRGYVLTNVAPPKSGMLRIAFSDNETSSGVVTRAVPVSVRP